MSKPAAAIICESARPETSPCWLVAAMFIAAPEVTRASTVLDTISTSEVQVGNIQQLFSSSTFFRFMETFGRVNHTRRPSRSIYRGNWYETYLETRNFVWAVVSGGGTNRLPRSLRERVKCEYNSRCGTELETRLHYNGVITTTKVLVSCVHHVFQYLQVNTQHE